MPSKKRIRFTYNWNNKLDCKAFTTLRLHQPDMYVVGEVYEIWLRGPKSQWAQRNDGQIIDIRRLHLNDVNPFIAYLDTGYSVGETKKILQRMYRNKVNPLLDFILIKSLGEGAKLLTQKELTKAADPVQKDQAYHQLVAQPQLFN